ILRQLVDTAAAPRLALDGDFRKKFDHEFHGGRTAATQGLRALYLSAMTFQALRWRHRPTTDAYPPLRHDRDAQYMFKFGAQMHYIGPSRHQFCDRRYLYL
ncbi:MAG: hypothetical protein ACK5HY_02715, partial [Parahaliea sp.]